MKGKKAAFAAQTTKYSALGSSSACSPYHGVVASGSSAGSSPTPSVSSPAALHASLVPPCVSCLAAAPLTRTPRTSPVVHTALPPVVVQSDVSFESPALPPAAGRSRLPGGRDVVVPAMTLRTCAAVWTPKLVGLSQFPHGRHRLRWLEWGGCAQRQRASAQGKP